MQITTDRIIGTGGTSSRVNVSSESIKTCIEPTGHKWGDEKWFEIFLQGRSLGHAVGVSRAIGRLGAVADRIGISLDRARAEYVNACAAEQAAKKAAAIITPVALTATLGEDDDILEAPEWDNWPNDEPNYTPPSNESDARRGNRKRCMILVQDAGLSRLSEEMRNAAKAKFGWECVSRSEWGEIQWRQMADAIEGGCWAAGENGEWLAQGRTRKVA